MMSIMIIQYVTVTEDMFSPHNLHLTEVAKDKPKSSVKLVPNLQNKTNYVIHYRALKQCVQLGMKITKVHKVTLPMIKNHG